MLKLRNLIFGLVLLLINQVVLAENISGSISVTAEIESACKIGVQPILLEFGAIKPGCNITSANIPITCAKGVHYEIALDKGTGPGATIFDRVLTNASGEGKLKYSIFKDASHSIVWGDGNDGSQIVSGTGNGLLQQQTLYGKVSLDSCKASPGKYTDTVTIVVQLGP